MIDVSDLAHSLTRIAEILDAMAVSWAIGGSVASAVYGEPRSTNDVDVIAILTEAQVRVFIAKLGDDFYANEDTAVDAVRRRSSFNVIDNHSLVKIDIFVPSPGPMGVGQLDRVRRLIAFPGVRAMPMLGPEDVVLQKLRWYRLGGEVSDRQWRDIISVLRLLADREDTAYLDTVATSDGLAELLQRARDEVRQERR